MREDRELLRRWVETWRRAGEELEALKERELQSMDAQEAIRQIYEGLDFTRLPKPDEMTGLVEQQRWFAKLREQGRP